jgi:hypothetical protein
MVQLGGNAAERDHRYENRDPPHLKDPFHTLQPVMRVINGILQI